MDGGTSNGLNDQLTQAGGGGQQKYSAAPTDAGVQNLMADPRFNEADRARLIDLYKKDNTQGSAYQNLYKQLTAPAAVADVNAQNTKKQALLDAPGLRAQAAGIASPQGGSVLGGNNYNSGGGLSTILGR